MLLPEKIRGMFPGISPPFRKSLNCSAVIRVLQTKVYLACSSRDENKPTTSVTLYTVWMLTHTKLT